MNSKTRGKAETYDLRCIGGKADLLHENLANQWRIDKVIAKESHDERVIFNTRVEFNWLAKVDRDYVESHLYLDH